MADDVCGNLVQLIGIGSTTGDEKEITDFIRNKLEKYGYKNTERVGNNLVVKIRGSEQGKPNIALIGHTDTVKPVDEDQLNPRFEKGYIIGRGAVDMKQGLAIMLSIAENVPKSTSGYGLFLVFYEGEEGPENNGIRKLLNGNHLNEVDMAYVLEPTNLIPMIGCMGRVFVEANIKGRESHPGAPWLGKNAIYLSKPLIDMIEKHEGETGNIEGMGYREAMSVTKINTDNPDNVVPGNCLVGIDYRYSPNKTGNDAKKIVRDYITKTKEYWVGVDPGFDFRLSTSWEVIPASMLDFKKEYSRELLSLLPKGLPKPEIIPGWTDIAQLNLSGIPAINLTPGELKYAHAPDERISEKDLVDGLNVYRQILSK